MCIRDSGNDNGEAAANDDVRTAADDVLTTSTAHFPEIYPVVTESGY